MEKESSSYGAELPWEPPGLAAFCELTSQWTLEDWQHAICDRLQRLSTESGQRVLIHGAPQFGKSIIISQRFPAWAIGRRPLLRVRLACYNVTHAERFSRVNLELLRSPEFLAAFPDPACRVPSVAPVEEWSTAARAGQRDAQASFRALGIRSGFVGLGADLLIVDDPYASAAEAYSEVINTGVWQWWTDAVIPRLNPATNVVVMFHRWRQDDLAGRLMAQGGWEYLRFPAIADGEPGDLSGKLVGEALSPRYPLDYLRDVERRQGPAAFLALYQGRPTAAEGNMLHVGKVQQCDQPPEGMRVYQAWDLAISQKQTADFTVGATLGVDADQNAYLLAITRGRWAFNETLAQMAEQAAIWKPQAIGIESVGYQAAAFQEATRRHMLPFREVKADKDKVVRAQLLAERMDAARVFADKRQPWWLEFEREALAFPLGAHDDQVDAVAYAVQMAAVPSPLVWESF